MPVWPQESRTDSQQPSLMVRGLTLSYKDHVVQQNLCFKAYAGEITGILGENGAGKTTFLRVVCGLKRIKQGQILLNGKRAGERKRRAQCGMVMQDVNYQLFSDSAENECMLGNQNITREEVAELLKEMHLQSCKEMHPQSLSGGQKQRLAIAAACASRKSFLLLDEPTSGLDYGGMLAVGKALKRLAERGMTILVVTHDREFMENVCDRLIYMDKLPNIVS